MKLFWFKQIRGTLSLQSIPINQQKQPPDIEEFPNVTGELHKGDKSGNQTCPKGSQ